MLQIASGKLFVRSTSHENNLRGVLFTNLRIFDKAIEGPTFGRISQTSELTASPKMLIFDFVERMEIPEVGPGVIFSHGADPYLQDMATILSFVFNCTCSPDIDLVRRLTDGQRGKVTGQAPSKFISRVFEKDVNSQPDELDAGIEFINQLLGLERKTYLGVLQAIRTYVTGIHRVAEDLELAYTLMVAAGESLTQKFDGYTSVWESVTEQKRRVIDFALVGASPEIADKVRDAVLSIEHASLARRFQTFAIAHVLPDYFEGQFDPGSNPPGRGDLPDLLQGAYQARSAYVHELKRLPSLITLGVGYSETVIVDRGGMLSLMGLSRLMRHVIMTFVKRQPTTEQEGHNYILEISGVGQVKMAPQYWIGRSEGDIAESGRDRLEGFLEQLAACLMGFPDSIITDLTDLLNKFLTIAHNINASKLRPYLALLIIFNAVASNKSIVINKSIETLIDRDLGSPCPEAMIVLAIFDNPASWTIDEHFSAFQRYKKRRGNYNGIRFPRLFEAAVALELAERYRGIGNFEVFEKIILDAADDYPDLAELRNFAKAVDHEKPVVWKSILLPNQPTKEVESASTVSDELS